MTDADAPLQREPDGAAVERIARAMCRASLPECLVAKDAAVDAHWHEHIGMARVAFAITPPPDMVPRAECIAEIEAMAAEKEPYRLRWLGTPELAPKAEASDAERAGALQAWLMLSLGRLHEGQHHNLAEWQPRITEALAAVRREATIAERNTIVTTLHRVAVGTVIDERRREWAKAADYLAANKPKDITPARDLVALLLAEAVRLAKSDDLEDQRRARGLQDAAELLEESGNVA